MFGDIKMSLPKQLVIIGGGASIIEGINKGLWGVIPKTFSCGLNYSYKYINTTVNCGIDEKFYNENYKDILKLPLYFCKMNPGTLVNWPKNCYMFKSAYLYDRDLYGGIYSSTLAGLFALSAFIKILDEGEIYLMGFDYDCLRDSENKPVLDKLGRPLTHFYQEIEHIEHRGIGKLNWYTSTLIDPKKSGVRITNAEKEFGVYANESKVKIYNVNPQSAINTFEKISYEQFFNKILTVEQTQDEIRKELEMKFKGLLYIYEMIARNGVRIIPQSKLSDQKGPFDVK